MALDFYTIATNILSCAYAGVDHVDPWPINRSCVVPGSETAWDDCQCGQLTIAETRRYPSTSFPSEEIDFQAECGEPWIVAVFDLTLVRCVHIPNQNGLPPSCVDLQTDAQQLMKDKLDIRRAVMCCLTDMYDSEQIAEFFIGAQESVGPTGACAGSSMLISVGLLQPCGCA